MFNIGTIGNNVIAFLPSFKTDLKIKHIIHNEDEYNMLRIGYDIDKDYEDVLINMRGFYYIGHKEAV